MRWRRTLRLLVGESLVELGTGLMQVGGMVRDIGGFVLPNYERHPAFSSNGDVDAEIHSYTIPAR